MNGITNKIIILGSILLLAGCASNKSKDGKEKAASENTSPIETVISDDFKTKVLNDDSDTSNLTEKSGSFNYSGNEPFARPTLFVSGEESYLLIGDENFIKNEYKNLNGKSGVVFGKIESQRFFKVYFYKINEEN